MRDLPVTDSVKIPRASLFVCHCFRFIGIILTVVLISRPLISAGDQQQQDQLSNQNTNDLLRPPQQPYEMQNFQEPQGIPQHQQPQQFQQQNPAFGQLNNMLISMLQQSAQAQQGNGQNPFQNAEAILAHILAAANSAGVAGVQFPQGQQQQMGFNANQPPDAQTLQQQLMMNLQQQQQHQGAVGNADNSFQGGQQQKNVVPPQKQQLPLMGQPFNQGVYNNFGAMGSFVSPVDGNAEQPAFQNQDYNAATNGAQGGFGSLGIQFEEQQQQQQQVRLPKNRKGTKDPTPLSSMLDEEQAAEQRSRAKAQPKKHPRAKTFPDKLMQGMMENPNEDIVAWLPDGRSFVVVDPDRFCTEIVGKVMKECKYPSFVRKLHRYV